MEPLRRFGKSMSDVLMIKNSFFMENDKLLSDAQQVNKLCDCNRKVDKSIC